MSVLLPLYMYPSAGAWDPLYTAVQAHTSVQFDVIINPCSGPIDSSGATCVDSTYESAIKKLQGYSNVKTLGYVATSRAGKAIGTLTEEVLAYGNWSSAGYGVDGIFFDEVPQYSETAYQYYSQAKTAVTGEGSALGSGRIVLNPGAPPDSTTTLFDLATISVVFEDTQANYQSTDTTDAMKILSQLKTTSSNYAIILYEETGDMSTIVKDAAAQASHVYITTNSFADAYSTLSSDALDSFLSAFAGVSTTSASVNSTDGTVSSVAAAAFTSAAASTFPTTSESLATPTSFANSTSAAFASSVTSTATATDYSTGRAHHHTRIHTRY